MHKFICALSFFLASLNFIFLPLQAKSPPAPYVYDGMFDYQQFTIRFPAVPNEIKGDNYLILESGDDVVHYYLFALDYKNLSSKPNTWNVREWLNQLEKSNRLQPPFAEDTIQSALTPTPQEKEPIVFELSTDHFAVFARKLLQDGRAYFIAAAVAKTNDKKLDEENYLKAKDFIQSFQPETLRYHEKRD